MKTVSLAETLNRYMTMRGMGNLALSNHVKDQFETDFVPKTSIQHWRNGSSKTVRDWRQLVAIAHVLGFQRQELEDLLRQSNHPRLPELRERASGEFVRVIDQWLQVEATQSIVVEEVLPNTALLETLPGEQILVQSSGSSGQRYKTDLSRGFGFLAALAVVFLVVFWIQSRSAAPRGWRATGMGNDDVDMIMVNDQIIGATYRTYRMGWVDLSEVLHTPNDVISLVHLNGPGSGEWAFEIDYNGETRWQSRGRSHKSYWVTVVDQLVLLNNGDLRHIDSPNSAPESSRWSVRIDAVDIGILLVNGHIAAGAYGVGSGRFPEQDITQYIRSDQENRLELVVWNPQRRYAYNIEIIRDDQVVWQDVAQLVRTDLRQLRAACIIVRQAGDIVVCE